MAVVEWAGEQWQLDWRRAVYWERTKSVLIADPHFGKDSTFRSHGLAIPAGSTQADLMRLCDVIDSYHAQRLIILGDFMHGRTSRQPALFEPFAEWRSSRQELEIVNVPGNHDRHAGAPPSEWEIQLQPEPWVVEQVALRHIPLEMSTPPAMAGHLHPAVRLVDSHGSLKLPCFWISNNSFVLPAFGSFIAMAKVTPKPDDKIFAICEDEVLQIPLSRK